MEELIGRLRALQARSGMSYRAVHRGVVRSRRARGVAELPALNTVYRCFEPNRARLDVDLVVDVARVLLGDDAAAERWRQECMVVSGRASAAAVVDVAEGLPADLDLFTGRREEILRITALAGRRVGGSPVAAVEGMPGVGKTWLAIHAGHALLRRGRFADVQLAVDLRGFDPARPPADPAAVLAGFLRRLGLPGGQIQRLDLAGRAERYRQLLHGRHALVLLDNAATAEQVKPLLPGESGCLVLITSRRRLDLPGLTRLTLGALRPAEAVGLLRRAAAAAAATSAATVAPAGVVAADADTAARIAEVVGHLPLALALVAERIRSRPDWALTDHLERLVYRQHSLQVDCGVAAALGLSYDGLGPEQRQLFRLLALHPGEAADRHVAGALAGIAPDPAGRYLEELLAASLLQPHGPGRYGFHDLVRVFAASRAYDEDAASARRAALTAAFDYYLRTAAAAAATLYPADYPDDPTPGSSPTPRPGGSLDNVSRFGDPEEARAWLDIERPNLLAVAAYAACHGWPEHTLRLARTLWRYLDAGGYHEDVLVLHRNVLNAVQQAGGQAGECRAPRSDGTACCRLGR